jgi:acetylglutamate kinase
MVMLKVCGLNPIVVHGGGPQINRMLDKLEVKPEFRDGLSVTDEATMSVVEMVLSGSINKSIVASIQQAGGRAVGISGKDGNLMIAREADEDQDRPRYRQGDGARLRLCRRAGAHQHRILETIMKSDAIPVIAPIGVGYEGETFNVNADTAAGAIATATRAKRLLLLTDVAGVLDKDKNLISELKVGDLPELIANGTVTGGMIPKVESAADGRQAGCRRRHHPRWPRAAFGAAGTAHAAWRGNAHFAGGRMRGFSHVDTWVFDLDNTLYPASCRLFDQIDVKMGEFVSRLLSVDYAEAKRRQKEMFYKYGTTLRGLMTEHGITPDDFLDYVHDIDHSPVPPTIAGRGAACAARPQAGLHQRHGGPCRKGAEPHRHHPPLRRHLRHRAFGLHPQARDGPYRNSSARPVLRPRPPPCSRTSRATSRRRMRWA